MAERVGVGGTDLARGQGVRAGVGLAGILLVAMNLRVGFTTVGPLLETINADLDLSPAQAGLLSGLPLLAFALFSPLAPALARAAGLDRATWVSLLVLAAGIVLRSLEAPGLIWAGTILIGAGIACLNVLVPSLVKRRFPTKVGQVTGLYTSIQGAAAALGAAIDIPVSQTAAAGWRPALGLWLGLALIALAAILPAARTPGPRIRAMGDDRSERSPWTSLLGWQVSLFMGFQSLVYYIFVAWLPTIERSHGVPETDTGLHMALFLLIGVGASLGTGKLMTHTRDQRSLGLTGSLLALAAFLGLATLPELMLVWIICAAIACGGLIVIALSLFSLRTTSHTQAASLSGMAQSLGYGLAFTGPLLFGVLYGSSGDFTLPLLIGAGCMAVLCVLAFLAGQNRSIIFRPRDERARSR